MIIDHNYVDKHVQTIYKEQTLQTKSLMLITVTTGQ